MGGGSWRAALVTGAVATCAVAAGAAGLSFVEWLYWTPATATFFLAIAAALIAMTMWELAAPCVERKGFLPITTTRGDRLFLAVLSAALIHMTWFVCTDSDPWPASLASALWLPVLMRWG